MNKNNIKNRIFLLQLIILLTPFIILNFYQYNQTVLQLENEQLKSLELKVDHVESLFNHFAEDLKTYALIASNMKELKNSVGFLKNEKDWDTEDQLDVRNYPKEGFNHFSSQEYDNRIITLREVAKGLFNTLNNEHYYIGNVEIVNSNLTVIMRGHRDKRGDIKSDKLIMDAVKGFSSSGLLVSKRTGQPAIDGTAPIYEDGQIVGAVKIGMYITDEVASQIESEVDVELLIFDHNKLVETYGFNDEDTINKKNEELPKLDIFKKSEYLEVEKIELTDEVYYNYIIKGKSYTKLYSVKYYGNYAVRIEPIKDYDGIVIGAFMVVVENDELINNLTIEKNESIKRILIILCMSLLISFIFSNQIGNPIINFKKQIRKMKEGDSIDYLEDVYGPQELLDMAIEFNSLVDVISYEKDKNETLEIISNIDGLTNLYNHQKFYRDIKILVNAKNEFSLIFLDLDKFKSINDRLGHSVGDTILREVSNLLKSFEEIEVDGDFKAYRYGGEEFAVLLNHYTQEKAYIISEKIRKKIESSHILKGITAELDVTISCGVAVYPLDAKTEADLVENADVAMYYSKKSGRNKTTLYKEKHKIFFFENSDDSIKGSKTLDSIKSLINALETRDEYTAEHSRNVMTYSMMFGRKLGFCEGELEKLKYSSLLHDCGKLGISESILLKKGSLTNQEFLDITKHTVYGYNIVNNLSNDIDIKNGILYHHENWDGSGYPEGLAGREIPLIPRIISITSSYQAMISNRPYREALTHEYALKEIINNKGIMYDPNLVDMFIETLSENDIDSDCINEFREKKNNLLIMESIELEDINKIYENSKINIVKIDKNYVVKFINQSALEKIEKEMDEIISGTCYSGIIGRSKPCTHCKVPEVLKSRSIQHQVKQEILNSGVVRKIAQVWVPIIDNNNILSTILEIVIEFDRDGNEADLK